MKKYTNRNGVKFEDFLDNNLWKCRVSKDGNSFNYGNSFDFFALKVNIDEFDLDDFKRFTVIKEVDVVTEKIKEKVDKITDKVIEKVDDMIVDDFMELSDDDKELLELQDLLENEMDKKERTKLKRKITLLKKKMGI